MNCGIRTEKDDKVVHTYVGLNNYIVKVYLKENGKHIKLESVIVDHFFEAIDRHTRFCKVYLLGELFK
jgi:hypothetical protein